MTEPRSTIGRLRRAMTERMLGMSVLRSASESMASLTQKPFLIVRVPGETVREGPAIAPKRRTIAGPHR